MEEEVTMNQPTYILVHGAFHGAWCWEKFTPELDRRGLAWRTVDLPSARRDGDPLATLADDAAVVAEASQIDGTVVLVGHSYGGCVITEATPLIHNLESRVYIAALVPQIGQTATETAREVEAHTDLDDAIKKDGPVLRLDLEAAGSALYSECDVDVRQWATAQLSTQTLASFRSPRSAETVAVLSRYILCRNDHAIDPSLQDFLATRCEEVMEIQSDHSPFLSHPRELADAMFAPSDLG